MQPLLAALLLTLTPWHGRSLPTATLVAAKYRLTVRGEAGQTVNLRVAQLPAGWMAAFCTPQFCAPLSYTVRLNDRGIATMEFEAIRLQDGAPKRIRLTIAGNDAQLHLDVESARSSP